VDLEQGGSEKSLDNLEEGVKSVAKVFLVSPKSKKNFCGPGMITLLIAIRETGNVLHACETMGMSYSKGWKLLKTLEEGLGFPVVIRHQGGKGGGRAYLTDKGQAFLKKYQAFLEDCQSAVQRIFTDYYKDRLENPNV
jgi:molybdate transport system regulatory protein